MDNFWVINWSTDLVGRCTYIDPQWRRVTGQAVASARGRGWFETIHQDDRAEAKAELTQAGEERRPFQVIARLRRIDGKFRWAMAVGAPQLDEQGAFTGFAGSIFDFHDRISAERELDETRRRLDAIMDAAPIGLSFSTDASRAHITGNKALLSQFEIAATDNISASAPDAAAAGRQVRYFRDGRELTDAELPLQMALRTRRTVAPMEIEVALPGGRRWIAEASAAPIVGTDGRLAGGVVVTIDVTERHRQLEALRASEERYRLLFESSRDGIATVDMTDRIIEANPAFQAMLGFTLDELSRLTYQELTPSAWHDMEAAIVREQVLPCGDSAEYEKEYIRKDGTVFPVSLRTWTVTDNNGLVVGMRAFVRDISERKQAEENLRESRALLRAVLDGSPDPVFLKDRESRWLLANPAAYAVAGKPAEACLGKADVEIFMNAADGLALMANDGRVIATEQTETVEETIQTPVGRRCFITTKAPFRDTAGNIIGLIGVAHDVTERNRAEAALRDSERRYRTLVSAASAITWRAPPSGFHMEQQPEWMDFTGQTAEEMRGEGWAKAVHPDDVADVASKWREAVARNEPFVSEHRIRRHDGVWRWMSVQAAPVRDARGEIVEWFGMNIDITRQREAEEALRNRNRQLDLLARTSQRLFLRSRPAKEVLESIFSDIAEGIGVESYFYFRPIEPRLLRLEICRSVSEEEQRFFATVGFGELLCGRVAETQTRLIIEDLQHSSQPGAEVLNAAGATSYAGFPLVADRKLLGIIAFVSRERTHFRDGDVQVIQSICDQIAIVFERDRLLHEFQEIEERLRLALEAGQLGFWDWDVPSGRVQFGGRWASMLGYDPGEVEPHVRAWESLVHPDERKEVAGTLSDHLEGRTDFYESEHRLRHKDGSWRWILDRGQVVERDADGRPLRAIGTHADVTARHEAEDALLEADRRKDEFLAVLAHELRNPLAPIRTSLQVLRNTLDPAPNTDRLLDMMDRQMTHLVRLVDDLLEVSRITRGKILLRKERVDIAEVVGAAIDACRSLVQASHHALDVSLPPEPLWLDADPVRITQMISNLLNNAAKYMEPGGLIRLAIDQQGGEAVVRVRDQGVGIPAAMLPKVFDLFTQVEGTINRAQGGLGIGLALVKRLAELHGGKVEAHSEGPGRGSEFVIRLPLAVAPAQAKEPRISSPTLSSRRARVLVVDDNRDAADSLALLLDALDVEVQAVYGGQAALESLGAFHPDVVLLDLGMPGMDGYETARRIRQERGGGDIKLIALTGWGQDEDRRRTREAGFDHHLVKPVQIDLLQALLVPLNEKGRIQTP